MAIIRLAINSWLMNSLLSTRPVLRLYCLKLHLRAGASHPWGRNSGKTEVIKYFLFVQSPTIIVRMTIHLFWTRDKSKSCSWLPPGEIQVSYRKCRAYLFVWIRGIDAKPPALEELRTGDTFAAMLASQGIPGGTDGWQLDDRDSGLQVTALNGSRRLLCSLRQRPIRAAVRGFEN